MWDASLDGSKLRAGCGFVTIAVNSDIPTAHHTSSAIFSLGFQYFSLRNSLTSLHFWDGFLEKPTNFPAMIPHA